MKSERVPARFIAFAASCYLLVLLYSLFVNSGSATAVASMEYFGVGAAAQSAVTVARTVGGAVTLLVLAYLGERVNSMKTLFWGALAYALCLAGYVVLIRIGGGRSAFVPYLVCTFFLGFGHVVLDASASSTLMIVFPERRETILPLSHMTYGLGAIAAPYLFGALISGRAPSYFVLPAAAVAAAMGLAALFYAGAARRVLPETRFAASGAAGKERGGALAFLRQKKARVLCTAAFFSGAFECSVMVWLPTYYTKELGLDTARAGAMLSVFSIGYVAVRALLPVLLRRFRAPKLCAAAACGAAASMAALYSLRSAGTAAVILLVLGGFFTGSFSVLAYLIGGEEFSETTTTATVVLSFFLCLSFGAASPVLGVLADAFGFRAAMYAAVLFLIPVLLAARSLAGKKKKAVL